MSDRLLPLPTACLLVLVGACVALLSVGFPSTAHDPAAYAPTKWKGDLRVNMAFTPSGRGTSEWNDRVRRGRNAWNALGQPMRFVETTPSGAKSYSTNFDPWTCPSTARQNGIHRGKIDGSFSAGGSTVAKTSSCWTTRTGASGKQVPDRLFSANIVFDNQEPWYTGTGTPPRGRVDLWSVSAHEHGHAAGFSRHFSATSTLCGRTSSGYHTLCPTHFTGSTHERTLATHDKDTFVRAYPETAP